MNRPTRMLDDPSEPAFVRELLRVGAEDRVTDYDYNKGLVKHLTIIAAGTLLPLWAKGLMSGSGTSSAVSGLSAKVIAFVVGVPIVTAGVVASIVISNQEPKIRSVDTVQSVPMQTRQNISHTNPQEATPLKGITIPDPAVINEHKPKRPTKSTTDRNTRSTPVKANRRGVKNIRSKAISSNKSVDVQFDGVLNATNRSTTKKEDRKRSSLITPLAKRNSVPELQREQAKKSRIAENPFERETRMLVAANRLLESDPERSLELAKSGEREFPGSMFTEERRHVLILALIKLSRLDEARQLAGPYLHEYPKSPFAQRVRHALAKAQRE